MLRGKVGHVAYELLEGGLLAVTLQRSRVNAMSSELMANVAAVMQKAGEEESVRGVLLKSAYNWKEETHKEKGGCFGAGLDLSEVHSMLEAGERKAVEAFGFSTLSDCFLSPVRCPKPVAAAVHGHCIAGGLVLALSCDYLSLGSVGEAKERKASYKLGLTELVVGVPFPRIPLSIVQHQLPRSAVRKLVFEACLVDEREASAIGVGDRICEDPEADALAWLKRVTAPEKPMGAYAVTKSLFWADVLEQKEPSAEERKEWVDQILSDSCKDIIGSYLQR